MAPSAARQTRPRPAPIPESLEVLAREFPEADCALEHQDAYQLLVATILSAQCTDVRVNMVTPALFAEFPDPASLAAAPPGRIEEVIRSTGFFNAKAKSLRGMASQVVAKYAGQIPRTMEELASLPGVGRKTANVVLGNIWNSPDGVVVDTHVGRLARRLGWSTNDDPEKVERDLNEKISRDRWVWISHALILHGRRTCAARAPRCSDCPLADLCPKIGVLPPKKGDSK